MQSADNSTNQHWALPRDILIDLLRVCTELSYWKTYAVLRETCRELAAVKLNVCTVLTKSIDEYREYSVSVNDHEVDSIWSTQNMINIKWQWEQRQVIVHYARGGSTDIEDGRYCLCVYEDKRGVFPYRFIVMDNMWIPLDALKTLEFIHEPDPDNSAEVLWESFWALCKKAAPLEAIKSAREQIVATSAIN